MAISPGTYYDVGDPEVRENWSERVRLEHQKATVLFDEKMSHLINSRGTGLVHREVEAYKHGGTRATFTLINALKGAPTGGNQTMRDREEGTSSTTDRAEINKIRHATYVDGEIVDNRVTWNTIDTSSRLLGEWFRTVQEAAAMMHLAGFNIDGGRPVTEWWLRGNDLTSTWFNAVEEPDADHVLSVNDKDPENFDSTDFADIDLYDRAVAMAGMYKHPIRPIQMNGDEYYIVFIHDWQAYQWRQAGTRWWSLAEKAIQGGMIGGSPIIKGTLGCYNKMMFVSSKYMPPCMNSGGTAVVDNTRISVLCGQEALLYGVGKHYPTEKAFRVVEERWDYGDKVGVAVQAMGGIKVPSYEIDGTEQRIGSIVIKSYAQDLLARS